MSAVVKIALVLVVLYVLGHGLVGVLTNPPTVSRATEACAAHAEDC
jgi:hypothetical protein